MAAPGRIEEVLDLLRSRGGRVTTPRRVILTALLEADDHVTADELTATVRARHPEVHQSTVYRTLDTLRALGVVDHVHLGHGRAVFHLADARHHHLVCSSCGTVVEVPDDVLADLGRRLDAEYGFALDGRHFGLSGLCHRCRRPSRPDRSHRDPPRA